MQNNIRSFGDELQNKFLFLDNHKKIKVIKDIKEVKTTNFVKSARILDSLKKRNSMIMKISHNPLHDIKKQGKENNLLIGHEKNDQSTALILFNDKPNAATKIASNKDKIVIRRDYFHSFVDDYGEENFRNIKADEKLNICNYSSKDILNFQESFYNEKSRGIILQWMVKYSNRWLLHDDTILMAMKLIDRFISKFKVDQKHLLLIAVTSFFIASKYEDIYPPSVTEFSAICKFYHSPYEIIKMERKILSGLNFDILYNSSYKFLTFLHSFIDKNNRELLYLAQLILEISLEYINILQHSQSKRAYASLLLAKRIMKIKSSWNDIKFHFNYNEKEMKINKKKMAIVLNNLFNNNINNCVIEKFKSRRYNCVSKYLENPYFEFDDKK